MPYTDPSGFKVAIPNGWYKTRVVRGQFDFQDPTSSRYLRFGFTSTPTSDPVAAWERVEASLRQRVRGYERIRIERVSYRSWATADWEFTTGPDVTRTIDRGFVVDSRHGYAIYLAAPVGQWSSSVRYFQVAADTFQPAR